MNYEKEYKSALGRARNLHKDAIDMEDSLRAKMAEIIFPELKESEDERIRTWLEEHIEAMPDNSVEFKEKEYKFKPGELVITRYAASSEWFVTTFSHIVKNKFFCGDGCIHYKCYPLKGNERFVGMTVDLEE